MIFQFYCHLAADLDCVFLNKVYPNVISKCNAPNLVFKNGKSVPYYLGKRSPEEKILKPDLYSFFHPLYDYSGKTISDTGRIRIYSLLQLVYGKSKEEIEKNLVSVHFWDKKLRFNKRNGAAAALQRVDKALKKLLLQKPFLKIYLKNSSSYYYRKIAKSLLLSSHSFGIAIDLNPKKGNYWQWQKKGKRLKKCFYPKEIVDIFEAQGFIWGGRWEHYDSFHFEYRPEYLFFQRLKKGASF